MKDTEQILAELGINNPTDAAMVRLATHANAMPDESVDALLSRVNFAHPRDAKLARAMVEAIRSSQPRSTSPATPIPASRKFPVIIALLAAVAGGCAVWALQLHVVAKAERQGREEDNARFVKQLGEVQAATTKTITDLQTATAAALKSSDTATRDNAERYTKQMAEYVQKLNGLTIENERLKAEIEKVKVAAARAQGLGDQK